jgi:putative flippase GtrA
MQKIKILTQSESFWQLVKYVLIGVAGLVVDFGIYTLLTKLGLKVEWANIISSTCGIINNFIWNSLLNFKVYDRIIIRFIAYFLVGQLTTVFTTIALIIFVDHLGYNNLLVKIIATFVATLIQFVLNKFITFRKAKKLNRVQEQNND